jgi:transcriptional regulator with XRE-family HTH domain
LLQQARLSREPSQQQVADELGISQGYVFQLESGKSSLALTRTFDIMQLTVMPLQTEIPGGSTDA